MDCHFLHLSDYHYKANWPEECDLIANRLIKDLESQKGKYQDAYLIFSGDLVKEGGRPDFYDEFDKRLATPLADLGFPPERRICIPGNHDASRPALLPKLALQLGSLSTMVDETTFNNNMPLLSAHFFEDTFAHYAAYEKRFAKYTCLSSGLGGSGWELPNGIGIYCLNTALCSFAGLEDSHGNKIDDKGRLLVDTRDLYDWLDSNKSATRILVMHHPVDWLAGWAAEELSKVIVESFRVVVSGHVHRASATKYSSRGDDGRVHCVSPALFTRKSEQLGYSFITISDGATKVHYRQWTQENKFVLGTGFSATDDGTKTFEVQNVVPSIPAADNPADKVATTAEILREEFDEALTSYAKKNIWVERDLAPSPETAGKAKPRIMTTATALSKSFHPCIIRAPKQFGLTCLGRLGFPTNGGRAEVTN